MSTGCWLLLACSWLKCGVLPWNLSTSPDFFDLKSPWLSEGSLFLSWINSSLLAAASILLSVWNGVLSHFWQWQSKPGWNFSGSQKSYVLERSTRISFVFSPFNIFGWKCCCFLPLWMKNSVICRGSFALETESWFNQQELWTCKLGLRYCYKNYWKKGPNIKAEKGIVCCAADHDGSSNAVLCIGKMFCVMKSQVIQGCVFRKLEIIEKQSHHTGFTCFRNYALNTLNN